MHLPTLKSKIMQVEETRYDLGTMAYALSYLTGFFVYLISKKSDKFTRFHAAQSFVLGIVLQVIQVIIMVLDANWLGVLTIWWALSVFVAWALLTLPLIMYSWKGEKVHLPLIGGIAESLA